MRFSQIGAIIGLISGVIWVTLGFWSMVLVLLLTGIGYLIGRYRSRLPMLKNWLVEILDR